MNYVEEILCPKPPALPVKSSQAQENYFPTHLPKIPS